MTKISMLRLATLLLVAITGSLQLSTTNAEAASSGISSSSFTGKLPLQPFLLQSRGGAASRVIAKNEEESETHTVSEPLTQKASLTDKDDPLVKDIELISDILAETVKRGSPRIHDLYTKFRLYGLTRAADINDDAALEKMIKEAKKLTASEALGVMRMFSLALNLVNAAEVHHRLRNIRDFSREGENSENSGPLPAIEDSCRGTFDILLSSKAATKEEIFQQLLTQKCEIVLTAHPTEVSRRSILRKYRRVSEILALLQRPDLHKYEKEEAVSDLRRIISSVWGADEIRRRKPTPQQEASGGIAIVESVLWDAVPAYLRKLDAQCRASLGKSLPVDAVPIKFASWIGGDRDGNPNVTPQVTSEVVLTQRLRAARLFLRDLFTLQSELAISSSFSGEMDELAATLEDPVHKREKYRRVIFHLIKRLVKTARECESKLAEISSSASITKPEVDQTVEGWEEVEAIYDADDLLKPLHTMYDSLMKTGFELIAEGRISDIIRRVNIFGLTLVPLDIREESTKHTEALDAITGWLGVGSYKTWSEEARLNFLQSELSNKRPFFRIRDLDRLGFEPSVVKTLRTFFTASTLNPSSLGAYVISQAQTASDVLAVMLLQKQVGMTPDRGNMMRVVPLFETLDDLNNAEGVLDTLFKIPTYVGAINGKQEVMVGYSDSAKDAGRIAAAWALYNNQEEMAAMARKHGIELTFFHGKGGTVGRGGNPALYRGILSHPPNTINGRFRVTEQGEMITRNFGNPNIAQHTLDIYTAAICREAFTKHVEPSKKWRQEMDRVSESSCAAYRQLVRGEPRFVPYFRQATPELELGSLNIGSRPSKRNPKGGIESLRAIPWTFAWTQTRTHLATWLGVGAGLNVSDESEMATLQEMYSEWPWFRETVDLISMIVSKTDFSISKNYDDQLVDKSGDLMRLGEEVREKLVETRQAVLDVTKSNDVGGAHVALLRASSTIRHPYVDPVNVIQAELLKRFRSMDKAGELTPSEQEEKEILQDALVMSINGIAQGMLNSG